MDYQLWLILLMLVEPLEGMAKHTDVLRCVRRDAAEL